MQIPVALIVFVLGLLVALITYIWKSLSQKIGSLDAKVNSLDLVKCRECQPVTVVQVKEIITNEFDKFRLELYKSGIFKPVNRNKRTEP